MIDLANLPSQIKLDGACEEAISWFESKISEGLTADQIRVKMWLEQPSFVEWGMSKSYDVTTNVVDGLVEEVKRLAKHNEIASSGEAANNASSGYWANNASSGYRANNASSGYRANNASSGYRANNASSGEAANNASSGNWANNASSGYRANNASSGYWANNASSGNAANNASSGNAANNASSGEAAVNVAAGIDCRAMAKGINSLIALVYKDSNGVPRIASGTVGEDLEAGVWYIADSATGKLKADPNQECSLFFKNFFPEPEPVIEPKAKKTRGPRKVKP